MLHSETLTKDGQVLDIHTDEDAGLRIVINRLGAEMISLARRDEAGTWHGFLYRDGETSAPATGWSNHATMMGYFLHRLWQEKSVYRGTEIKGGNHGFLRHFHFDAPLRDGHAITYSVPVEKVPAEAYPLKVSLDIIYSLSAAGVKITFKFHNYEPELDAHVSFGLHPGFAVTSVDAASLVLPAGRYIRHMAPGNFLSGELQTIDHAGGESPFPKAELPGSYILGIGELADREFILEDAPSGRRVGLDFSDVPYVTLWSDMNPFYCVEPCWGLPDSNPPTAFEDKPGIQHIPAGGELIRHIIINPHFSK